MASLSTIDYRILGTSRSLPVDVMSINDYAAADMFKGVQKGTGAQGTILISTHLFSVVSTIQTRCEVNRTTDTRIFSRARDRCPS